MASRIGLEFPGTNFRAWPRWALELCIPYLALKRQGRIAPRTQQRDKTELKRALPHWQIFLIAVGGVIGITIFSTHGEILWLAGPGGLLAATAFVSVTMICVMECIAELVILWPVSNAMIEYVRAFVDEDLAIVMGIAYWYAMSSVFSTLIIVAAEFAKHTITHSISRGILFYVVVPLILLFNNLLGVEYYGFIEGVGGLVKLLMVASGVLFMIIKASHAGPDNLEVGLQYQPRIAGSKVEAICIAIPLISYGYLGTEIVSVTAFEAIDRKDLRFPARFVSYILAATYFLSALLQSILVDHKEPTLQKISAAAIPALARRNNDNSTSFDAVIVIAAKQYGSPSLGQYFNGCIIYFCISAANTALYVASRTLFGLTRGLNRQRNIPSYLKPFRYFGMTTPTRQVPLFALVFSAIAFYWLIPLQVWKGYAITDMLLIMSTTASIGGILVWGSQCIAFIRYYRWFHKFKAMNTDDVTVLPPKYNRWNPQRDKYEWHAHRTLLADLRLVPACVGLTGCFLIAFVLSTATWWYDGNVTLKRLGTAYAGPVILTALFIFLKIWNRRWWVNLDVDPELLAQVIDNFERNANLRFSSGVLDAPTEPADG